MINNYKYKDSVWIDIIAPTKEEVRKTISEYNVHPTIGDELIVPSYKSRVELFSDYIYVILHFPAFKHSHNGEEVKQEIDFIIGKNFLITARYDSIDAIDKFSKIFEVNTILDHSGKEHVTGFVFFGIVQEIYRSLQNELDYIENQLDKIEEGIFSGKEKEMVISLSLVSRNLLNFNKSTIFHKEVLESLVEFGKKTFDDHFVYHVNRVLDEYYKIRHAIQNNVDSATELRETNNSLLSTKQNEIMKTLTIMAFVTFPLTLIASIFSLNTSYLPLASRQNGFWIVMAVMAGAALLMFLFFKHKKWL